MENTVPATITVKNIPDAIYGRLRVAAQTHHRSINSELIACLERALLPRRISVEERIDRARQLRAAVRRPAIGRREIAQAIRAGRP
jgi:plasmid stability protein